MTGFLFTIAPVAVTKEPDRGGNCCRMDSLAIPRTQKIHPIANRVVNVYASEYRYYDMNKTGRVGVMSSQSGALRGRGPGMAFRHSPYLEGIAWQRRR